MAMSGKYVLSYRDYSNEVSRLNVTIPTLNAGNIAAQDTLLDNLLAAIDAVVIGTKEKEDRVYEVIHGTGIAPASKDAQVERKWLVSARDDVTGFPVTFSIPTADSQFVSNNTDKMDLAGTEGAALVAAIEAVVLSKAGNAITVTEVRMVGRNL
jgi:hypothetical protein